MSVMLKMDVKESSTPTQSSLLHIMFNKMGATTDSVHRVSLSIVPFGVFCSE